MNEFIFGLFVGGVVGVLVVVTLRIDDVLSHDDVRDRDREFSRAARAYKDVAARFVLTVREHQKDEDEKK